MSEQKKPQAKEWWKDEAKLLDLSARDGSAVIHGVNEPALTWEQLQDWVQNKPEAKKPLAAQRNLFGDDE